MFFSKPSSSSIFAMNDMPFSQSVPNLRQSDKQSITMKAHDSIVNIYMVCFHDLPVLE